MLDIIWLECLDLKFIFSIVRLFIEYRYCLFVIGVLIKCLWKCLGMDLVFKGSLLMVIWIFGFLYIGFWFEELFVVMFLWIVLFDICFLMICVLGFVRKFFLCLFIVKFWNLEIIVGFIVEKVFFGKIGIEMFLRIVVLLEIRVVVGIFSLLFFRLINNSIFFFFMIVLNMFVFLWVSLLYCKFKVLFNVE